MVLSGSRGDGSWSPASGLVSRVESTTASKPRPQRSSSGRVSIPRRSRHGPREARRDRPHASRCLRPSAFVASPFRLRCFVVEPGDISVTFAGLSLRYARPHESHRIPAVRHAVRHSVDRGSQHQTRRDLAGLSRTRHERRRAGSAVPERWSTTENVAMEGRRPGQGWSSPIVWGDAVFLTSGDQRQAVQAADAGLYGNDYIAELRAQGLSDDEISGACARATTRAPEESDEIRYMVYALDARTGKIKWERRRTRPGRPAAGIARTPTRRKRRSPTASGSTSRSVRTSGSSATRSTASCSGRALAAAADLPRFGTASSPTVHDGRVYLLHDSEADSYIAALDAKTGAGGLAHRRGLTPAFPHSSWTTPYVWTNAKRTEIVTPVTAMVLSLRPRRQGALAYHRHVDADGVAARVQRLALRRHAARRATRTARSSRSSPAPRRHHARRRRDEQRLHRWRNRASRVTRRQPSCTTDAPISSTIPASWRCLNAKTGQQIYKVRVGGGGHTFSASPVAAGNRISC